MPKAYMMVHLEVTNPEAFAAGFGSKVADVAREFGGKFLVQLPAVHRYENQFNGKQADVHGILEFPDRESAIAWYESDQYKAILPARLDNTANAYSAIVDGVDD